MPELEGPDKMHVHKDHGQICMIEKTSKIGTVELST